MTSATYRDNYIPLRELSGTVMQLEKYLFRATRNARLNESCWNDSRERQ
ncbi:MAG TPA: hypothetical protein VJU61_27550 [Polyangiaceae bacterium]|nr:hypothetical protein [Polyangiaceae bacterium]